MEIEKIKFKNIIKTMTNDCEKFANSLQVYNDFKKAMTHEEWEQLINSYDKKEVQFIEETNDRYYNHLDRIEKITNE